MYLPPAHTKESERRQYQNHHSTMHSEDKQQGTEVKTRGSGCIHGYTSLRGESQALDRVTQWGCAASVLRVFQDWSDRVPGDLVRTYSCVCFLTPLPSFGKLTLLQSSNSDTSSDFSNRDQVVGLCTCCPCSSEDRGAWQRG